MKPTKIMPYIVAMKTTHPDDVISFAFKTQKQAEQFIRDNQSYGYKTSYGIYVSIEIAKRGKKK